MYLEFHLAAQNKDRQKRNKIDREKETEDLPTKDHVKITLLNPLRRDHIAFVRKHDTCHLTFRRL